jgi:hypothetical protein
MKTPDLSWRSAIAAGGILSLLGGVVALVTIAAGYSEGSVFSRWRCPQGDNHGCQSSSEIELSGEPGGTWYWLRSPEEEKRVVASSYNRYCIRCHGVDGRGVWDIPDVPDFTSVRWQSSRSDGQLARLILEGRGAVMPHFRGTLALEEAWAMARYLRTFVPGTEVSRPDFGQPANPSSLPQAPAPKKLENPSK